ncbi:hypothetical protein K493DRAFT_314648 [Basidiobolus meristosporus CBS 931.73]|uniref:Uncharacterized protein n=1 Tax=Basidiobolus meristosporus CBS 931.73 TaxID=1314790 RepID=A0A1Y1YDY2_9FUNG|nr:hypothetical protein K493DRAFT_314648 [Basidiobolus meristosporus CBS 931.73]|eukprot:ORX96133.1 hypothetical protein K493DRAFT_314648 [Basidiobolus meristosporus CBS 931.73]
MCPPNFQWGLNGSLLATLPFTELPALTTDTTPPLSAPIFNFPNINVGSNYSNPGSSQDRSDASISLREIIDRFADKPETMDLLLKAKMEEDRRLTEQYRYKIELAREETKKYELKILNHHSHHHSHSPSDHSHSASDHHDDVSSDDNSVSLDPYNDPLPTQAPLTPPTSVDENNFIDTPLDSKADYSIDIPQPPQPLSASLGSEESKKRKATPEFPIEYCVMMDSKQRSPSQPQAGHPNPAVTMETVQRKVRIKQMNKKERPQQKFMQMMKLVNSKN